MHIRIETQHEDQVPADASEISRNADAIDADFIALFEELSQRRLKLVRGGNAAIKQKVSLPAYLGNLLNVQPFSISGILQQDFTEVVEQFCGRRRLLGWRYGDGGIHIEPLVRGC